MIHKFCMNMYLMSICVLAGLAASLPSVYHCNKQVHSRIFEVCFLHLDFD